MASAPWLSTPWTNVGSTTPPSSSPHGSSPAIDQHLNARTPDVFLCTVSPPDQNGYCSFGSDLWNKRTFAKLSRTVLAEVDERFIRTYGDNYIHVSEIDAFVENTPQPMHDEELNEIISAIPDAERRQELTEIASKLEFERRRDFIPQVADLDLAQMRMWAAFYAGVSDPGPKAHAVWRSSSPRCVPDGATIQIGTGTPSTLLPTLGAFDDKHDLGIHSEMAAPGLIDLIEQGHSERPLLQHPPRGRPTQRPHGHQHSGSRSGPNITRSSNCWNPRTW